MNDLMSDEEVNSLIIADTDNITPLETVETTEIEHEDLSESIGSEEDIQDVEDSTSDKEGSDSPNLYSSIATALLEDGILSNLEKEFTNGIKTPEEFSAAIEKEVQARLDEKQRRINEALEVGVEPSKVKEFESTLEYFESITEDTLADESTDGENIRKQLIYQDFINKGFTEERAKRELEKSFKAGTDIDDAKEALISNREYFNNLYKDLVNSAKQEEENFIKERTKQAEEIKKSILETEEIFEGINLDKATRQRIFDNISKPIYKDSEGNYLTALQKFEVENRTEFIQKLGAIFTLTDGFKNFDKLVKPKVTKAVKKNISSIERAINNTARDTGGNLRFASAITEDEDSYDGIILAD